MAETTMLVPASRLLSPSAIFGLLTVILVCSARAVLSDGDTYTHLAAGLWMIEHRTVLTFDPLSATFAGAPWVAHEWLSEVLIALAYRAAGLSGVIVLTAAAAGLAFADLARHVGRWSGWPVAILLTAASLICVMPSVLARPHILALPFLEVWVAGLLQARQDGRAPSWRLLPVMAIWANLHGGFAFGLALAAAFAFGASWKTEERRVGSGLHWWIFCGASVCAAMLTPRGLDGLLFPFRLMQLNSLAYVNEWQPIDFTTDFNVVAVLLMLILLLATKRIRLELFRSLLLIGLVYLSLAHVRHGVLIGIAGPLILAQPVGRAFATGRSMRSSKGGMALCWSGLGLAVLVRLATPVITVDSRATPITALAQLPPAMMATPVLNSVQFGGYLALTGIHPFVDGRVELFGDGFLADLRAMAEADPSHLAADVDRYGIAWALLAPDDPLVTKFTGLTGWQRQYGDNLAVLFVRS